MSKTFALQHPTPEPCDPHTLGTLAASLVTCTHPGHNQVRTEASDSGHPIWCAACGALRFGDGPTSPWQVAALPSLLTKKHFDDVVVLLHSIRQLALLAGTQRPAGALGSRDRSVLRSVRASLVALARLPIVRGLDRLEAALGEMPSTFDRTGEQAR
jgi:hypothetical protein